MSRGGRFRYALQPVLLTRQWELDALMQELSVANAELAQTQQQLAQLVQQMQDVSTAWEAETAHGLNPARFALVTRYLAQLSQQRQEQEQILAQRQEARDELIDKVAKARRAVDAAEEHRDEELAKFTREQMSAQFKEADDQWSSAQTGRNDD